MSHIEADGFSPHRWVLIRGDNPDRTRAKPPPRPSASRSDEWNVAWRRSEHCIDDNERKRNTDQRKDKAVFGAPTIGFFVPVRIEVDLLE
jgi:hypothetical protein